MSIRGPMTHICIVFIVLSLFFAIHVLGGCGKDSPVVEDPGNGGEEPPPPPPPPDSVLLSIRVVSWDDLSGQGPVEETPGDVENIYFEISAPGTQTQTRMIQADQPLIEEDFTIKTGAARRIDVQAFNAADSMLYISTKYADLVDSVLITAVGMVSTADGTPPVYAGLEDAVAISDTYVLLSWQTATDGSAPDNEVLYLIYMSTDAGSMDYSYPAYTSAPGETSFLITGLDPATTYYFVARAMDRAGNIDSNTSMLSITTSSAGSALYVDVKAGSNHSGCGTAGSPCKTITYALSKTAGNQTIHVAKGTYNAASGEVFPLQLKPGTILEGEGFWWMGVKVIKLTYIEGTTPVILGADDASIFSCYVKPTAWGSSIRAIDDDGHPITVFHCTIDGTLFPGGQGIGFSAGSSLIDCRVEAFSGGGGRAVGVWGTGGALIKGNVVINNSQGIFLQASNSEVNHNIVEDIGSVGISIGTTDLLTDDIVVFHNHISNCGGDGVSVINTDNINILYNSISESGGYGIAVNQQESLHMVDIKNNSISKGNSSGIWLTSGGANINWNAIVCNVAGVFLSTDQVVDLRWNMWDHDPPTISPGRGPYDPGCDGFYDICYERDYAFTPEPLYQPDSGLGSCLVGVIPSPRK